MHTPEQAASLWCPMVRIGVTAASGGPSTINDPTSIPEFSGRCIADKCAMWRWADAAFPCVPMVEEPARPAAVPADAQWHPYDDQSGHGGYWMWTLYGTVRTFSPHMVQSRDRAGYCGLAGRPEVV
ncbi:hypothetical protein FEE59_13720 [Herbaspirillum sp. RU 5E]|nr:hypothetical protein [Herbaspirillum sp. RU 5E]